MWFVILAFIFIFLFLFWLFPVIEVCGDSMYPTLHDGEHVLGRRVLTRNPFKFKLGDIYVYTPPEGEKRYVIKRLSGLSPEKNKELFFTGDNSPVSHDSRSYGFVSTRKVVAKVLLRKQVKA